VRQGSEEIAASDGAVRVAVPVLELVGGRAIHATATFEVSHDTITAIDVGSELLRP
jgi:hypothetical protein